MDRSFFHHVLGVGLAAALLFVVLPACSDDPILGPSDGTEESGGSYSVINRLAPPSAADSSQSDSTSEPDSTIVNPDRF